MQQGLGIVWWEIIIVNKKNSFLLSNGMLAFYLYHYAEKVRKDPDKSLVAGYDYSDYELDKTLADVKITGRQKIILIIFFSAIAFLIFASVKGGILGP